MEKFACPCCGNKTYTEKPNGSFVICQVCYWEDDLIQFNNPEYEGGPNRVSLRQGQLNYEEFGACEKEMMKHVRLPQKDEVRDNNWQPL